MIIALTGTPGTGKTSVAAELGELTGYEVVDLTKFVKNHGLGAEEDGEYEVDVEAMVAALEEELDPDRDYIIDGHLSHHYSADYCVVLRTNPEELRKRLSQRSYDKGKINENVEAETLDSVLIEAVGPQEKENIIEIDTTDRAAADVAKEVNTRLESGETGYGSIDWTEYL